MEQLEMKNARKVFLFIIGICAGSLILTACNSQGSTQDGGGDVTGKVWNLTLLKDKALLPGSNITAQFTTDGKVGGSSGCNRYAGSYTSSGNHSANHFTVGFNHDGLRPGV